MNPTRFCTCCNANGVREVRARYVAADADGLEWFECGQHNDRENVARVKRVSLTLIEEWYRKHGLGT